MCAVFTHHLRSGDKGHLHWGKVLVVEGSGCTIKWQTDKKPSSHSIADVFRPRQLHGLLLIALQVLIVHQRTLCIRSLTTKLLTHKRQDDEWSEVRSSK